MQNRAAQQAQQAVVGEGQAEVSMAELVRQKEELEDMIAAQQAQAAK